MHLILSHAEMLTLLSRAMGVPVDTYRIETPIYGQIFFTLAEDASYEEEHKHENACYTLFHKMGSTNSAPNISDRRKKGRFHDPVTDRWLTQGEAHALFALFRGDEDEDRQCFVWRSPEDHAAAILAK